MFVIHNLYTMPADATKILQKNQLFPTEGKEELILRVLSVKLFAAARDENSGAFIFNDGTAIEGPGDAVPITYSVELWGNVHSPVFLKWLKKPGVKIYDNQGSVLVMKEGKLVTTGHRSECAGIISVRFF